MAQTPGTRSYLMRVALVAAGAGIAGGVAGAAVNILLDVPPAVSTGISAGLTLGAIRLFNPTPVPCCPDEQTS